MKTIRVRCKWCGQTFQKSAKEVVRTRKRKGNHFCNLSHAIAHGNKVSPRGGSSHLDPGNLRDQYTPFRYFLRSGKGSMRRHGSTLTLAQIKQQWDKQNGRCAYTGLPLVLPDNVNGWVGGALPDSPSLDRIDSCKPYTVDNIEFVCLFVNFGKNRFTRDQVRSFISAMRK